MKQIDHYINIIKKAARSIEPEYFRIPTTFRPLGIVRERVFCYELYHRIRTLMGGKQDLTLNGEIDKRGHIDFDECDWKNPDFVFHIPGTHHGNTIVVEVKGTLNVSYEEFLNDISTLLTFVNKYGYRVGIFLLYNHSYDELIEHIGDRLIDLIAKYETKSIIVLCIKEAGGKVEEIALGGK